jgi:hypothetical protein
MKKKPRIRKRSMPDDRIKDSVEPEEGESSSEKEAIEASSPCALPPAPTGKFEVMVGFGIMGLSVGFLSGYGNMNVLLGVIEGLAGFGIGLGLGYMPYMNFKK